MTSVDLRARDMEFTAELVRERLLEASGARTAPRLLDLVEEMRRILRG